MSMKKDGMMYGPWNPIPTFSMAATSLEMCIFANGLKTTCAFGACLGTFDEPDLHEVCRSGFVRELDQGTQVHAPSRSSNSCRWPSCVCDLLCCRGMASRPSVGPSLASFWYNSPCCRTTPDRFGLSRLLHYPRWHASFETGVEFEGLLTPG